MAAPNIIDILWEKFQQDKHKERFNKELTPLMKKILHFIITELSEFINDVGLSLGDVLNLCNDQVGKV